MAWKTGSELFYSSLPVLDSGLQKYPHTKKTSEGKLGMCGESFCPRELQLSDFQGEVWDMESEPPGPPLRLPSWTLSVPVVVVTEGSAGGHQWWGKASSWRSRPFRLRCPGGHLKQLKGTEWPKGLQHWWLLKLKLRYGRHSVRPWRITFGGPHGCSGKPFGELER